MSTLAWVEIRDFRCVEAARIEAASGTNLLVGPNAAGKTSLLEAVFSLSRGRSFRTHDHGVLVRRSSTAFTVVAEVHRAGQETRIGIEGRKGHLRARIGGEPAPSLLALAETLVVQAVHAEIHELIEGAPSTRRRFLDWGVFHVKPDFLTAWRRYQRALRQRNAALKQGASASEVEVWDRELLGAGETLDALRREHLDALGGAVSRAAAGLLGLEVTLDYRPGWPQERTLAEAVAASWPRDRATGTTQVGPHRADLALLADGLPARHHISRGQQKLLAAALVLAQSQILSAAAEEPVVLLLDDPVAELDREHLDSFLDQLAALPGQRFVTGLRAEPLEALCANRVFHVEQGRVRTVL